MKTPATMTVLLLASALGLQAQSSTSPTTQTQPSPTSSSSSAMQPGSQEPASPTASPSQSANASANTRATSGSSSSPGTPSSTSSSDELKYRTNQPTDVQQPPNSQASTDDQNKNQQNSSSSQTNVAQTGSRTSSQTDVAVTAETETQVRTVVQQIDAQGPVVVERISTEFADATCTQENARALVEALHNGTSVTLRNEDGQTATFTPTVHLGYGDAYIAMAVAVEALRDAGITGCASPAQWQAVLLGGELRGPSVRTTSVTTERFPGVLVLHEQGGWTKVAQTTHVQLNQVVSQANSSLQINNSSTSAQANNTSSASNPADQQNLSPTGFERGHDPRAHDKSKEHDDKGKDHDKDKDKNKSDYEQSHKIGEQNSPDTENPPKSETPPKY